MGRDKLWLEAAGLPLIAHTMSAVARAGPFDRIAVAADPAAWDRLLAVALAAGLAPPTLQLVAGGERRQDSVRSALSRCAEADVIVVHDAARPLAAPALFGAVATAAAERGAATTAIPIVDTVKRVDERGQVVTTVDRSVLAAVQTPQAFRAPLLRRAHEEALRRGWSADDDCALVEALGEPVVVVAGDPANLKVTHPGDVAVIEARLRAEAGRR